jgi:hypothetical protein
MFDASRIHCKNCDNTGWVCEAHENKPWEGPLACGCGEPGAPCPVCNCLEPSIDNRPDISRTGFTAEVERTPKRRAT